MGIADRYEKMRHITHCPACETQFFVTDEQLNQHEGKVRCGQCLQVFNARQQIVEASEAESHIDQPSENTADPAVAETPFVSNEIHEIPVPLNEPFLIEPENTSAEYAPSHLDDFLDKTKLIKRRKQPNKWLWWAFAIVLLLAAILQSLYFLRNELALYYPATKPYLEQACQQLNCKVELPKKIEFIVIDDSDIQEDAQHAGLIWLSSTLVNQAAFNQAYPNLELTLTDVEDKPKLRRIILPREYLPAGTDLNKGLWANEEIRIRLPISTQNEVLAGYRVLVTY
jgi:predicted Zn finger-like uncharacterized protein